MGFEAGLAIVILAILLDRIFKQPESAPDTADMAAVEFRHVDIIFGDRTRASPAIAGRRAARARKSSPRRVMSSALPTPPSPSSAARSAC
jgi:hypothetical protein